MTNPKDEAASEFEKAYEEFRHKHINASFMPKEMASFMWLAGRASKEICLPSDKIDYWIDNTKRLPNYNLNAMFHYVHEMEKFLNEIKALNECEGI